MPLYVPSRAPKWGIGTDEVLYGIAVKPQDVAAQYGLEIVFPGPRDLQLDLDSVDCVHRYEATLPVLQAHMRIEEVRRTKSYSGNTHVYLTCDRNLQPAERIALQAALGSDSKREALSMVRLFRGETDIATLLFEVRA